MKLEELSSYEIIEKREIADINSVTYLCRHKKTGARVALVSNDDENKVFYIGFRTTPKDSTGVAHILEHSVLCGSLQQLYLSLWQHGYGGEAAVYRRALSVPL